MGSDTPPHITAMFDQHQAIQDDQDRLPDGVIAQVRIRRADVGDHHHALAASFTLDGVRDDWEAAALLLTLEGVAAEFGRDLIRNLAQLMASSPAGFVEGLQITQLISEGRASDAAHVKRAGESDA